MLTSCEEIKAKQPGLSSGTQAGANVAVAVGEGVAVAVGVKVGVFVGIVVGVSVGMIVGVFVGVSVGTVVFVGLGVLVIMIGVVVGFGVFVWVLVEIGVLVETVGIGVLVAVADGKEVFVDVTVGSNGGVFDGDGIVVSVLFISVVTTPTIATTVLLGGIVAAFSIFVLLSSKIGMLIGKFRENNIEKIIKSPKINAKVI